MNCDLCQRFTHGAYDFGCDRCLARHHVREPRRVQDQNLKWWKQEMELQRFEEMERLIAEERARLLDRVGQTTAASG